MYKLISCFFCKVQDLFMKSTRKVLLNKIAIFDDLELFNVFYIRYSREGLDVQINLLLFCKIQNLSIKMRRKILIDKIVSIIFDQVIIRLKSKARN